MTFATLSLSHFRHRWLRSAVLVASVALASALLIVSAAVARHVSAVAASGAPVLVVVPLTTTQLPRAYVQRIATLRDLRGPPEWTRFDLGMNVDRTVQFGLAGASVGLPDLQSKRLFDVDPDVLARWKTNRQGMIATGDVLERAGWRVGEHITIALANGERMEVDVVGVTKGGAADGGWVHYDYLNALHEKDLHDVVETIEVPVAADAMEQTAEEIRGLFGTSEAPVLVVPYRTFNEFFLGAESWLPLLVSKVSIVFGALMALVLLAMLFVAIRERRAELGTLRAIGFSRARVFSLIVAEACLVCMAGGVVGAALLWALFARSGLHLGNAAMQHVPLPATLCVAGVIVAGLFGVVVATVPALSAAKADPLQLLGEQR